MNDTPLIRLSNVTRTYPSGGRTVPVLHNISLVIHAGEMVAITGPSGSGKSTLMNIMGGLDKPSVGEAEIAGMNTHQASRDQLAALRCRHIGFIFQRYHLVPYLTAEENVAMPARYTTMPLDVQLARARQLLVRLGLEGHMSHHPSQLSGGQQQRVSIARSLMNGASIILADEPTGALDASSGKELMMVLHGLHALGHTIIVITHDPAIAQQAGRIIEINDGAIVADRPNGTHVAQQKQTNALLDVTQQRQRLRDTFSIAWQALSGHRIRAILSMLGIIIGVTSVITSMAVGEGAKQKIIDDISAYGTKTISVRPGTGLSHPRADFERSLNTSDAILIENQSTVARATPILSKAVSAVVEGRAESFFVYGTNENIFHIQGMRISSGRGFNQQDIEQRQPLLVLEGNTAESLFPHENPIGKIIQLSGSPFIVTGVANPKGVTFSSGMLRAWTPYTALQSRLDGQLPLSEIVLQTQSGVSLQTAQHQVEQALEATHGRRDFYTERSDMMLGAIQKTSDSLTLLIASIAGISLIVGGVGVMNIMLVSVTERTHEIGIRLAVGAREVDIMRQFLVEAVVICLLGCVIGIGFTAVAGSIFSFITEKFKLVFTLPPILFSCGFSVLIGLSFGFFPARNAARLNPTEALARE